MSDTEEKLQTQVEGLQNIISSYQHEYSKLVNESQQNMATLIDKFSDTLAKITTQHHRSSHTSPTRSPRQQRYNMNNSQETFSGSMSENINHWLKTIENNMTLAHIPKKEWVLMASTYLKHGALLMYESFEREDPSWNDFCHKMKAKYFPEEYKEQLIAKIHQIKYKGSLQKFIEEFNLLATQIEDMPASQTIYPYDPHNYSFIFIGIKITFKYF